MSGDGLWCNACDRALPYYTEPHCPICAQPNPLGAVCGRCVAHPPQFTRTTAAFSYHFPLDQLILAMKFGDNLALVRPFAEKLALRIDRDKLPDILIPMPLHPDRLRERGYNQSLLIARHLAKLLNINLIDQGCRRIRATVTQSSLPWKERGKNMRDAFRCDLDLTGKKVALLDDVMTSGASLNALAQTVRERGASDISAWVVARTLPRG
jgi:ComF family protein